MRIGFVFNQPPHSSPNAREGLDALLATSAYSDDIEVFFIGQGVLQLLKAQQTDDALVKNYSPMFKLLNLYDIEAVYASQVALDKYQITQEELLVDVTPLATAELTARLAQCNKVVSF